MLDIELSIFSTESKRQGVTWQFISSMHFMTAAFKHTPTGSWARFRTILSLCPITLAGTNRFNQQLQLWWRLDGLKIFNRNMYISTWAILLEIVFTTYYVAFTKVKEHSDDEVNVLVGGYRHGIWSDGYWWLGGFEGPDAHCWWEGLSRELSLWNKE